MADWSMVQVVLAVAFLPFVIQGFWLGFIRVCFRRIMLLIESERSTCEQLLWSEADDIPDGPLHVCGPQLCQHPGHAPSSKCWTMTFGGVYHANPARRRNRHRKPDGLPLNHEFLCTDRTTVLAFILCTIDNFLPRALVQWPPPSIFDHGSVIVAATQDPHTGIVRVHVEGQFRRHLTKVEASRLLNGYPPFYRETLQCGSVDIPSPIKDDSYVKRGGWVIGVGLSNTAPVPVYMDCVKYTDAQGRTRPRSGVFWQSFDWVLMILKTNILPLFPHDRNINATINAIVHMVQNETDSNGEPWLVGSDIGSTRGNLYRPECMRALAIFNQTAPLPQSLQETLRADIESILLPVLTAAYEGVRRCIEYMKNPGRELDRMLPELLLQNSELLYAEGCL
ncbi:hypothetical protein BDD12DRAFT_841313 [Trichophaea hybrida]|nr:hypothetical protein BDD12DRAFT_841313 [Trichophaea hybrida]